MSRPQMHPSTPRIPAKRQSTQPATVFTPRSDPMSAFMADVRPVRMRQLIARRLGLVGRGVGVRLDDDEEAEYQAPQRARTPGASSTPIQPPPSPDCARRGRGRLAVSRSTGRSSVWSAGRRDLGQDRCRAIRPVLGQEQFLEGGLAAEQSAHARAGQSSR